MRYSVCETAERQRPLTQAYIDSITRETQLLVMIRQTVALRHTMALGPMITNTSVPVISNPSILSSSYHRLSDVQFLTLSHKYTALEEIRLSNPRDTLALTPSRA